MKRIKLVFLDMDGTIYRKTYKDSKGNTAPSAWTLISEKLGPEAYAEEDITKDKWNSGAYSGYVEWMEDTLRIHQKHGLTKNLFDEIIGSIEYNPGVKESVTELRRRGYKTALISGGFKAQSDKALTELKLNHAFAACEHFWDGDGNLLHWNLMPCDYEGKLDFMKLIMREHGVLPSECAFIGDGRNDIHFAKAVGMSIAFNGAKELQEVCTHSVNQEEGKEDFRAVLEFFE